MSAFNISSLGQCLPVTCFISRIDTPNSEKPPCAVIVTVFESSSYDDLFRAVQQTSPDPNYSIALFQCNYADLSVISSAALDDTVSPLQDLLRAISQVEPSSVVFNFECCAACSERGFSAGVNSGRTVISFLSWALRNKYLAMFGDFSLKALIAEWSEDLLGPNPFVQIGVCDHTIGLKFDPPTLRSCPIAQLQNVGEMCDTGESVLHALSATIVYTIDMAKADTPKYSLEVLTIAKNSEFIQYTRPEFNGRLKIGDVSGNAGHVLIRYPEGGSIVTSAGHWIELSRLEVNEERVLEVARRQLGEAYVEDLQVQLASCTTDEERSARIQDSSRYVVQSSAPCSYSARR